MGATSALVDGDVTGMGKEVEEVLVDGGGDAAFGV